MTVLALLKEHLFVEIRQLFLGSHDKEETLVSITTRVLQKCHINWTG